MRTKESFEEWILFILEGIEETSEETLLIIKGINQEIEKTAEEIKGRLPKIYSKELIELLFFEFYTKRVFIENGLNVSRKTASNYLAELEKEGFLSSEKIGKERIYVNKRLFDTVEKAGNRK